MYVRRRRRAMCVAFQNQHNPSQIIFHNIPDEWPSRQMAPHVTRAAWTHNTIWPKAVQIWPVARLVTPAIALKPMAQGTVHHFLNSLNGIFIARAQQRQITMGLIFFFEPTSQVIFNGKCNYTAAHLVQKT